MSNLTYEKLRELVLEEIGIDEVAKPMVAPGGLPATGLPKEKEAEVAGLGTGYKTVRKKEIVKKASAQETEAIGKLPPQQQVRAVADLIVKTKVPYKLLLTKKDAILALVKKTYEDAGIPTV